jgi:hypothetical protein
VPHQQHALGYTRTQLDELFWLLEELDHLAQFILSLVHTGHVVESDRGLIPGVHAGAALAKRKRLAVRALELAQHHVAAHEHGHDQQNRTTGAQQGHPIRRLHNLDLNALQLLRGQTQVPQLLRDRGFGSLVRYDFLAISQLNK